MDRHEEREASTRKRRNMKTMKMKCWSMMCIEPNSTIKIPLQAR